MLRRATGDALEGLEKVEVIVEAQGGGNLVDGHFPGGQEFPGPLDAQLRDIGGIGLPRFPLEQLPQVVGVHVHLPGNELQGTVFGQMLLHKPEHVQKGGVGQLPVRLGGGTLLQPRAEGLNHMLKGAEAEDQMLWVQKMENIRQRAEEIVLEEIIYS